MGPKRSAHAGQLAFTGTVRAENSRARTVESVFNRRPPDSYADGTGAQWAGPLLGLGEPHPLQQSFLAPGADRS